MFGRRVLEVVLVCASTTAYAGGAPPRPPDPSGWNVLLLILDDCRADALGDAGNAAAPTPNLDRFAAEGVRFEHAFAQAVCCNPSRVCFLSGLRPPTTRVFTNAQRARNCMPPEMLTLPQMMRAAGFHTAAVGKLFHHDGEENAVDMMAFDRLEFSDPPEGRHDPPPTLTPPPPRTSQPPAGLDRSERRSWRSDYLDQFGDSGLSDEDEEDGRIARTAAELIRQLADERRHFFLAVGTARPHAPLLCPLSYLARVNPESVTVPPGRDADQDVPQVAVRFGRSADLFMDQDPEGEEARSAIAAYHACVSFVDAQLGLILDALEETGLWESTIVVVLADHGFHLGEHDQWSKYTLFDPSVGVPLIFRVPGASGNGSVCEEIVELVDLVPTLAELVGLDVPASLEGTSLVPLLQDSPPPWKRAAFTWLGVGGRQRSVRTKTHRYTEWQDRGETVFELYDLRSPGGERVNLAGEPAVASVQSELAVLLQAGWRAAATETAPAR